MCISIYWAYSAATFGSFVVAIGTMAPIRGCLPPIGMLIRCRIGTTMLVCDVSANFYAKDICFLHKTYFDN